MRIFYVEFFLTYNFVMEIDTPPPENNIVSNNTHFMVTIYLHDKMQKINNSHYRGQNHIYDHYLRSLSTILQSSYKPQLTMVGKQSKFWMGNNGLTRSFITPKTRL
jgi:hypothetical protein